MQTYQTTYYVVKMTKNKAKGNDMKPYEKEIKKIAEETKLADQTFVSKVISDELKAANVKIKDDAFKNALAGYMQTESSSASSEKKNQNQVILKQAIPKQATLKKQQILQAKQQNLLLNKHKKSGRLTTPFIYLWNIETAVI